MQDPANVVGLVEAGHEPQEGRFGFDPEGPMIAVKVPAANA